MVKTMLSQASGWDPAELASLLTPMHGPLFWLICPRKPALGLIIDVQLCVPVGYSMLIDRFVLSRCGQRFQPKPP